MNRKRVPLLILCLTAAISPSVVVAQIDPGSPNQQSNPVRSAPDSTSIPDTSVQDMQDKAFLRKAAEGGMAQVQLGQLAQQKASSQDVRQFGEKMVQEHSQLNDQLKPIAEQQGVLISTYRPAPPDATSPIGSAFARPHISTLNLKISRTFKQQIIRPKVSKWACISIRIAAISRRRRSTHSIASKPPISKTIIPVFRLPSPNDTIASLGATG